MVKESAVKEERIISGGKKHEKPSKK